MNARGSEVETARDTTDGLALATDLGWAIRMVSSAFSRVASSSVVGLPGGARGYLVLVALADGEPPTQLALANDVGLDRTVMTYLLDDLEAEELIVRRPDPSDRRARQVVLTGAGRERLGDVRSRLGIAEEELLRDLSDGDAISLRALLSRIALTAQRDAVLPGATDC